MLLGWLQIITYFLIHLKGVMNSRWTRRFRTYSGTSPTPAPLPTSWVEDRIP